jgi:hypothetical protein
MISNWLLMPTGGDHGVQREHDVDQHDLDDHAHQAAGFAGPPALFAHLLHLGVDLDRGFVDQEQPTEQQHQVPAADALFTDRQQRCAHAHHPAQREEQEDPREHREEQPQPLGFALAVLPVQFAAEDGDDDDVVDAQHDLQHRQREQRDPSLTGGQRGGVQAVDQIHAPKIGRADLGREVQRCCWRDRMQATWIHARAPRIDIISEPLAQHRPAHAP